MAGAGGTHTPYLYRTDKQNKPKQTQNVRYTFIQVQYKVGKASGSSRKHARAPIGLDRKARAHACHIISKRLAPRTETLRQQRRKNSHVCFACARTHIYHMCVHMHNPQRSTVSVSRTEHALPCC